MYDVDLSESLFPAQTDGIVRETTVAGVLREVAAQHSSAPAVVDVDMDGQTGRTWTYGELLSDSEKLALALSTRFRPGERIVVWAPNIPEWLLMEYACALAGIVLVTANPSYQAKELRYVLEQSGSVALFLVESYRGNPMSKIAMQATDGLDAIREIVDMEDTEAFHRIGDLTPELPDVAPGDAAQIQYTSGTTGFPKGAVLTHRGLVNNARLYATRANAHRDSVQANFMPLFHTAGCAMAALGSLQMACKMLLIKFFDPDAISHLIESKKVTTFFAVPTMLVALLESLERNPRDMSSVEAITTGGAPVAPELVRSVRSALGCDIETAFGQTEASPIITQSHHDGSLEDSGRTGSSNRPVPTKLRPCRPALGDPAARNAGSRCACTGMAERATRLG